MTRPFCRDCRYLRRTFVGTSAQPTNTCTHAAFPRALDLVTGAVTFPGCGTMRASEDRCGVGGAGYARVGLARRVWRRLVN